MTRHEKFIEHLRQKANGRALGRQAEAATHRPPDYCELSPQAQWDIDKRLGILDWDGDWDT